MLENELKLLKKQFISVLRNEIFSGLTVTRYNQFQVKLSDLISEDAAKAILLKAKAAVLKQDEGKTILAICFSRWLEIQPSIEFVKNLMFFNKDNPNRREAYIKKTFKSKLKKYTKNYAVHQRQILALMFCGLQKDNRQCMQFVWNACSAFIFDYKELRLNVGEHFREMIAVFQWIETEEIINFTRKILNKVMQLQDKDKLVSPDTTDTTDTTLLWNAPQKSVDRPTGPTSTEELKEVFPDRLVVKQNNKTN